MRTALLIAAVIGVLAATVLVALWPQSGPEAPRASIPAPDAEQTLRGVEELTRSGERMMRRAILSGGGTPEPALARSARSAWQQARATAAAWVRTHPKDLLVRPQLARLELLLDRPEQAEAHAEFVLRRAPRSPRALWVMGQVLHRRGDPEFRTYFRRAAESPAADTAVWLRYGLFLLGEDRLEEAQRYLSRAREAGSDDPDLPAYLGRLAYAREEYERAAELLAEAFEGRTISGEDVAMLADAQLNAGRPALAEQTCRRALTAKIPAPGRAMMGLILGEALLQQGRSEQAVAAFRAAGGYPPAAARAQLSIARALLLAGDRQAAAEALDRAAEAGADPAEIARWRDRLAGETGSGFSEGLAAGEALAEEGDEPEETREQADGADGLLGELPGFGRPSGTDADDE
jgi:tetratricopeptide (TPR) repeat protein